MPKVAFPYRKNITARSWMYTSCQTANLLLLLHQNMLLLVFLISTIVKCDLLRIVITLHNANLLSKRSKTRRRPSPIRGKVYFILLFAHFVLVHVIKRISNEFSFHTMYYETRCVFYIPSPEARGYKTHNSFHNTSYGMKIHLRSYIYTDAEGWSVLFITCFQLSINHKPVICLTF